LAAWTLTLISNALLVSFCWNAVSDGSFIAAVL